MPSSNPARLVSLNVGQPRTYGTPDAADPLDRPWRSAIVKSPVPDPVRATRLGLEGDAVVAAVHGGPDKAMLAYAAAHYPLWRTEHPEHEFPHGSFGDNLVIEGLDEHTVCLGDVYAIGDVRIEVSQPRGPCATIGRRFRDPEMLAHVQRTGRTGWYVRVLREGEIRAGLTVELRERPLPEWTVERATRVMHHDKEDLDGALALASLPVLADSWRKTLNERLESHGRPRVEISHRTASVVGAAHTSATPEPESAATPRASAASTTA